MTCEQKIDAMISMLNMAKTEIRYTREYYKEEKKDPYAHCYGRSGFNKRSPNLTYIKENLMQVHRTASILKHNMEKDKEKYFDKED